MASLDVFSPETRAWFEREFAAPTPAQAKGWPAIASGKYTLIQAPTGSGKTLAAFLYAIDKLTPAPGAGMRVLYVSPLKALNYDVERNLRGPLAGLRSQLRVAVRTGDTSQKERQAMLRDAPDILITTPESLFLLLTSQARELLRTVDTVIVDEVHAVAGTKRGAHLALSLERLERLAGGFQRVGLSATQRPLEEIGRFVAGGRPIELVDAGVAKKLDLEVVVPLEDMREPTEQHSIWPSIYPAMLELVRAHRSTIVFVNNRRLAERLALRLNELAEEEVARAHHGSLAREQRILIEEDLKAGRIPCLVATSSLELGIDMGAVDLVIQVESPKSVARGLQRIGRAGHTLDAVSKGRIFPKFRADLLEAAVVLQRMLAGAIEETQIPRNPLDVLAQQIVAICADEEIEVTELHTLVRGAYPFADLSRAQLENVLDMLAGRYPSDEFAELRPRIVWDRTAGVIRGREGARRLAVTNAGTIPDRGLFGVFIVDGGGRVGELDEEMVYEAREGQVIVLGASSWRIEEITRDRVLVSPAPGVPGAVPFWKGEGVGRPYELGAAIGKFSRELLAQHEPKVEGLDDRAAWNLIEYLREQERATGVVPSDRTVVVERFRDEIGDWRICILTPFGGRVHAPWAMAVAARLRESLGVDVQSIWSDDGIAFHLPESDAPPATDQLILSPEDLDELVLAEVGQTALFGARFRENAARALLIPRRRPGERSPLWQQRLKAQNLLQVARKYASFPIVLETYRECLQDVFDLPALKKLLHGLQTREIDLVDVETSSASPFASSLLFDYIATYMYEDDTPPAERRAQALSLDRDLLRELLGQEELRELIDADALADVEASLRRKPRNADELHDLLRLRGHQFEFDAGFAETLVRERRAFRFGAALAAAEDAGRYRDALGVMPPSGLPEVFLEGGLIRCGSSCAGMRVGAGRSRRRRRTSPSAPTSRRSCARSSVRSNSCAASCVPAGRSASGAIPKSCAACGVRRSRRCGARWSRRSRPRSGASCRTGTGSTGARRCARRSSHCRRCRCRCRCGSRTSCRAACPATGRSSSTSCARRASSCGSARGSTVSRCSSATMPGCSGSRPRRPRRKVPSTMRSALRSPAARSSGATSPRTRPCPRCGISSGPARSRTTRGNPSELRRGTRYRHKSVKEDASRGPAPRRSRLRKDDGRWPQACSRASRIGARLRSCCSSGRGSSRDGGVRGEGIAGGYGAVYQQLRALETLGTCRRGYFVEGLGGAQFALGGAVERLRELRPREGDEPEALVLAAADPAQPYGAALPWPKRSGARAARVAGAHVVLLGGEAALFVERGGRSLVPLRDPDEEWLRPALAALVSQVKRGRAKRLAVERFDSEPVADTMVMPLLIEAGFLAGPRRAVLRA